MAEVSLAGETFRVISLDTRCGVNVPATGKVAVRLSRPREIDALSAWLGERAMLRCEGPNAAEEAWRVAEIAQSDNIVELELEGPLAILEHCSGDWAGAETSLLDAACAVLEEAGATPTSRVAGQSAARPMPLIVQPEISNWDFLLRLAINGGFALVETLVGDEVQLLDGAEPNSISSSLAQILGRRSIRLERPRFGAVVSRFEKDGNDMPGSAGPAGHAGPMPLPVIVVPGLSSDPNFDGRLGAWSTLCGGGRYETIDIVRGDIRPGARLELPGGAGVRAVTRVERKLDDNGYVCSRLMLCGVEREAFLAAVAPRTRPIPPRRITIARMFATQVRDAPGYVTLELPRAKGGTATRLNAQLIAQGGGAGAGPSILPSPGATVALAFVGDDIAPRPMVLGVLRDGANPPPQHGDGQPSDVVLARSAGGTNVRCVADGGKERVEIELENGATRLTLSPEGLEVKAAKLTLSADGGAVEIRAGEFALSADSIELKASSIAMEKG